MLDKHVVTLAVGYRHIQIETGAVMRIVDVSEQKAFTGVTVHHALLGQVQREAIAVDVENREVHGWRLGVIGQRIIELDEKFSASTIAHLRITIDRSFQQQAGFVSLGIFNL